RLKIGALTSTLRMAGTMTTGNVTWSFDRERTLRGLGGITVSASFSVGGDDGSVFGELVKTVSDALQVCPFDGVAVTCRGHAALAQMGAGAAHPAALFARRYPSLADKVRAADMPVDDERHVQVACILLTVSSEAAGYLLARQQGVVLLFPRDVNP